MSRFWVAFWWMVGFWMVGGTVSAGGKPIEMTVFRSPTCSCCGKWVQHMKQNGFAIKDIQSENMAVIKRKYAVPDDLQSCHTAIVDGHVVEGHVPAEDVRKLVQSGSVAYGASVPGMPVGTPGMEMGTKKDPFDVVQFEKGGKQSVLHAYPAQ